MSRMLTRAARKRALDEARASGAPIEVPYKMPNYVLPRRDKFAWWEVVKVLLPSVSRNRNVERMFKRHVEKTNGVPQAETLFMKSLVATLANAARSNQGVLAQFLKRKSLDQYTNSGFNSSLELMETMWQCCNWERVRERYLYVQIRESSAEIHFGRRECLLRLDHGRNRMEKTVAYLSKVLRIFIKARVSAIYIRSYGPPGDREGAREIQRKIEMATQQFDFEPGIYFKPISNAPSHTEKAGAEHVQFIITQSQDKNRATAQNLYSERFLLFDRSREFRYFW